LFQVGIPASAGARIAAGIASKAVKSNSKLVKRVFTKKIKKYI
jgi:hypothetical protein